MKKRSLIYTLLLLVAMCLSGCGAIGEKMTSMSIIYAVTAVVSLLLLILFNCVIHKKDVWYQLLFASIFIVNLGYFTLSISKTLEEALLANRISYLGSVFLPMSMYLLILNVSNIKYHKWVPIVLLTIGIGVFLIAASPGYSDIYYKEVFLTIKNGATVLKKVYGPLHSIYLYYLLGYFSVMLITLIYTTVQKKIESNIQAIMLLCAVSINIFVWLIEQLVHIDFEILSVSYIISELFLISLQLMAVANTKETETESVKKPETVMLPSETVPIESPEHEVIPIPSEEPDLPTDAPVVSEDQIILYREGLSTLTPTERVIFNLYISGNSTKEIMASLNIKENTLKFHNKNIYGKLGVTSRKQLIELNKQLNKN